MITSPITTPHFHSRVLALITSHLSESNFLSSSAPAPILPPLTPVDTPLTPGDVCSQVIAYASPWIDLCSPDPLISNISRQVLNIEIAYASFCGVGNIIIPGPRTYLSGSTDNDGLVAYARAIQEALAIGSYIQMALQIPMYGKDEKKDLIGDLLPLARESYAPELKENKEIDLYETWDAWNLIRTVCKYNSRLSVGKKPIHPFSTVFSTSFQASVRSSLMAKAPYFKFLSIKHHHVWRVPAEE